MKFGIRKPSIKRSISARTKGRIKRTIKKASNPLYGKKGMGYVNDSEKAVYNKIYHKTTIGVKDIVISENSDKRQEDYSKAITDFKQKNNTDINKTNANIIKNHKNNGIFLISLACFMILIGFFLLPAGLLFVASGIVSFIIGINSLKTAKTKDETQIKEPETNNQNTQPHEEK